MSNSKPKLLMFKDGAFFSGHFNRQSVFVDIAPCKVVKQGNVEFVGEEATASIHMGRKELFTNGKSVLSFNVLYNGDNRPFITVLTITGPIDFILGDPLPTREEFNKTARGKSCLVAERAWKERQERNAVWQLMSQSVDKVAKKLLNARPKQTRRFSSGQNTFSVDEIFEFVVEEIGPQYSISAIILISEDHKILLHKWVRNSAHRLVQETYQTSKTIK